MEVWTEKSEGVDYVHFKQLEKGKTKRSSILVYVSMFSLALDHPHQDGISEHDGGDCRDTMQNHYN